MVIVYKPTAGILSEIQKHFGNLIYYAHGRDKILWFSRLPASWSTHLGYYSYPIFTHKSILIETNYLI